MQLGAVHGPVVVRGLGAWSETEGFSAQPPGELISRGCGTGVKGPGQKGVPRVGIETQTVVC